MHCHQLTVFVLIPVQMLLNELCKTSRRGRTTPLTGMKINEIDFQNSLMNPEDQRQ